MNQSFVASAVIAIGAVIAAVVGVYGVKWTIKFATRAQAKTTESEAYIRARQALEATIDVLQRDVAGVRTAQAEDRRNHRDEMADLRTRIDAMEVERTGYQQAIASLTAYIRRLMRLLRDNKIIPPPVPVGMDFDED